MLEFNNNLLITNEMKYIEIREYNNRQKANMYSDGQEWEIPLETAKNIISQLQLTVDNQFITGGIGNPIYYKRYYL